MPKTFFVAFIILLLLLFILVKEPFQIPNYEPSCPCQRQHCRGCQNCMYRQVPNLRTSHLIAGSAGDHMNVSNLELSERLDSALEKGTLRYRNMCGKMGYNLSMEGYQTYKFNPSLCKGGCVGNCNLYNSGKEMNVLLPNETDCPYYII
jgi:hypothetical protein